MSETANSMYTAQLEARINSALRSGNPKSFFNNFDLKFRHSDEYLDTRHKIQAGGLMDTPNKKILKNQTGMSDIFLNQSPRQFFETIDGVTTDLGFSNEIIDIANDPDRLDDFFQKVAKPVFLKLIEIGYHYIELTI